jgi:hypothetical protein
MMGNTIKGILIHVCYVVFTGSACVGKAVNLDMNIWEAAFSRFSHVGEPCVEELIKLPD